MMPAEQKLDEKISELKQKIRWVAEAIHERPEFSDRARQAASQLGLEDVPLLAAELHTESSPPDDLRERFPGLGQWIAVRQFAIFEMLYFIGPTSMPFLWELVHGEYDWTQGNAIEILCRFAAQRIDREGIIEGLKKAAPKLRFEACLYALEPLLNQAASDPEIQSVLDALLSAPDFKEAYDELTGEVPSVGGVYQSSFE